MSESQTQQKIQQIQSFQTQARRWRIAAASVSIVLTVLCLAVLYHSAFKLVHEGEARDQFITEFKKGLSTQVYPQAKVVATDAWRQLAPRVKTEVTAIRSRSPELADGISRELELLSTNLPAIADGVLRETVGELVRTREAKLRELAADITPEKTQRMLALLRAEGERRVGSIADVVVTPYETTLHQITADIALIRNTETAAGTTEAKSDALIHALVNVAENQLAATSSKPATKEGNSQQFVEVK